MSKYMLNAAQGIRTDRKPVWFLRQAGRYLPEYMELRRKHAFVESCQTPSIAAEITLQPLRRFDLDAAIIFSDILIPCTAMGQTLTFDSGHGPKLSNPVRSKQDLNLISVPKSAASLSYVGEAIALTKQKLNPHQTMIGFAGAPFTVASYMIEGAGSKDFTNVKKLMFEQPEVFKDLLKKIADVTYLYLEMQVQSGADIVMLFDTWLGQLTASDFNLNVYRIMKDLLLKLKQLKCPIIYYPGQGCDKLYELEDLSLDVVAIDWRTRLSNAEKILKSVGQTPVLQGNLDPQIFMAPEHTLRARVREIMEESATLGRPHIFNVGHGLMPHIPISGLECALDEIRKFAK